MRKEAKNKLDVISIKVPSEEKDALKKLAYSNGRTLSDEIRLAIDNHVKNSNLDENLDEIVEIVSQVTKVEIDRLGNRLAALMNRNTIISATSYYSNLTILSELLPVTSKYSFEEIERRAKKYALNFANTKKKDSLKDFLNEEYQSDAIDYIKSNSSS